MAKTPVRSSFWEAIFWKDVRISAPLATSASSERIFVGAVCKASGKWRVVWIKLHSGATREVLLLPMTIKMRLNAASSSSSDSTATGKPAACEPEKVEQRISANFRAGTEAGPTCPFWPFCFLPLPVFLFAAASAEDLSARLSARRAPPLRSEASTCSFSKALSRTLWSSDRSKE